jgi:hypothetical protein
VEQRFSAATTSSCFNAGLARAGRSQAPAQTPDLVLTLTHGICYCERLLIRRTIQTFHRESTGPSL